MSAYAGILLGVLFVAAVFVARSAEVFEAQRLMQPAFRQARDDVRHGHDEPDVDEITDPNPELSMAAFSKDGHLICAAGPMMLSANLQAGKQRVGLVNAVIGIDDGPDMRLVAALPWRPRETILERLALTLALLWFPLVAGAGAVTWASSRATFAPLLDLTRQAEALSESDLSRRLVVQGSDEYAAFAASLNGFIDRIDVSLKQQERFVMDAAHELRTPLTVLRGRIETTLLQARSESDYRAALEQALTEAERLTLLAELLLRSAAPSAEPLAELDLEVAAERAHARWVDRFAKQGVELCLESHPARALISETEIDIVLDNLLSNALRVSPHGSRCRIESTQTDRWAVIRIIDEGPGVPTDQAEAIFGYFVRGDATRNRAMGGFGVGLAVSHRIVTARGGQILVENPGEAGAVFCVCLPLLHE